MALTQQQSIWIQRVRTLTETLASAEVELEDSQSVYQDRDFAAIVGADPEAQQEIRDQYDLEPVDLADMMSFVTAVQALLDNGAPVQRDWRRVLNRVRELT